MVSHRTTVPSSQEHFRLLPQILICDAQVASGLQTNVMSLMKPSGNSMRPMELDGGKEAPQKQSLTEAAYESVQAKQSSFQMVAVRGEEACSGGGTQCCGPAVMNAPWPGPPLLLLCWSPSPTAGTVPSAHEAVHQGLRPVVDLKLPSRKFSPFPLL